MAKSSSRSKKKAAAKKKVAAKKTAPKAKKGVKKARKGAISPGKKKQVNPFPDGDELSKAAAPKRAGSPRKAVRQVPPFPDDDHEL